MGQGKTSLDKFAKGPIQGLLVTMLGWGLKSKGSHTLVDQNNALVASIQLESSKNWIIACMTAVVDNYECGMNALSNSVFYIKVCN